MPRIQPVQVSETQGKSRELLEGVQKGLGMVPNLLKTLGHSPAALAAYHGISQALGGALDPALREQLSLAIAGVNSCDYCASAHTALGAKAGLKADEMAANLQGQSASDQAGAALRFAQSIVRKQGRVSDQDLHDVRAGGYSDAQIVEIVSVVALNILTNYLNHVADTEIDFPVVEVSEAST